jgi:hypothetical protein
MKKKQNKKKRETVFLGVSGVIGVSAYSGVACTLTPCKSNGVSGVSIKNSVVLS